MTLHICTFYIYALIDPRTHKPFYVGQTPDPDRRLKAHIKRIHYKSVQGKLYASGEYIKNLHDDGLKPQIVILETLEFEWIFANYQIPYQRERYWINQLKSLGYMLANDKSNLDFAY